MNPVPSQFQAVFTQAQEAFATLALSVPSAEAKASFDAWMGQTLAKMGAVPRADFDTQREMLLALRERAAGLEALLDAKK